MHGQWSGFSYFQFNVGTLLLEVVDCMREAAGVVTGGWGEMKGWKWICISKFDLVSFVEVQENVDVSVVFRSRANVVEAGALAWRARIFNAIGNREGRN